MHIQGIQRIVPFPYGVQSAPDSGWSQSVVVNFNDAQFEAAQCQAETSS